MLDSTIAARLTALRHQRKSSVREVSEAIGLPYRTVQNYLSGRVSIPATFVAKCCELFNVEADIVLFGGIDLGPESLLTAVESVLEPDAIAPLKPSAPD